MTAHPPDLLYIAGNTSSPSGVATPGAHDVNLNGPDESLIAKYNYMATVLPIELLAFDAEPEGAHHVRVTWTTATETNNANFTVERSSDGVDFIPIARVEGAGTTQQTNHYVWLDREPLDGLSYYRLVQTDADGSSTRSSVDAVQRSGSVLILLGNPVRGELRIALPYAMPVEVVDASCLQLRHVSRCACCTKTPFAAIRSWSSCSSACGSPHNRRVCFRTLFTTVAIAHPRSAAAGRA
ncbi:MAG: hypothetical protein IPN62_17705 [Flavobacteriales bacterium]|nr:hypothetical protein [Flavobacteriales bacterium]